MIYTEIVKMGDDYGAMKKWSHHQDRFHKLLSSGFLSDLEIKVKSKLFRAHKLIIATGSPFLYEKICQASSSSKFVVKDDVDPDTFDAFLKVFYLYIYMFVRLLSSNERNFSFCTQVWRLMFRWNKHYPFCNWLLHTKFLI